MLARIALRIATVEALKNRTLVGEQVLDSQIGALDFGADGGLSSSEDHPFIAVYTDASSTSEGLASRALHKAGATELTIEAGIAATMTVTDAETGESKVLGLPATDQAFEFYLDCVGRQIAMALDDPDNEWAEVWRNLTRSVLKIERKRTSDGESGTRIAAHQMVITVDLMPDPVPGEPLAETSSWARLLAKMEATGHPYLATFRLLIGSDAGGQGDAARRFGLTLDEIGAMLLTPLAADADPGEA